MRTHLATLMLFATGCTAFDACGKNEHVDGTEWTHPSGAEEGRTCPTASDSPDLEPNESLTVRSEIKPASCAGSQKVSGAVWDDVDTFHVRANRCDRLLRASLESGEGVRFCLFAVCKVGTGALVKMDPDAANVGVPMYSPEGVRGHCRTGKGPLVVQLDCAGDGTGVTESEVDAFFVVDAQSANACTPYAFTYQF